MITISFSDPVISRLVDLAPFQIKKVVRGRGSNPSSTRYSVITAFPVNDRLLTKFLAELSIARVPGRGYGPDLEQVSPTQLDLSIPVGKSWR